MNAEQRDRMMVSVTEDTEDTEDTGKPVTISPSSEKRTFDTGATRDTESGKLDYEGFMSPLVMERYAEYLNGHRTMSDGSTRDSDNWQKGIPFNVYMKSGWRHFHAWWKAHRGWFTNPLTSKCDRDKALEDTICGLLFNASGYLHEHLRIKSLEYKAEKAFDEADLASQESEGLDVTNNPHEV